MIQLDRDGDVFVLRFASGENRFSPTLLDAVNAALDEVEGSDGPRALVTTGSGKFYSNGLDMDYMLGEGKDRVPEYLAGVLSLMGRILTFPTPTVAATNGHAFGAGGQTLLAHDIRLMREERGFFCMPEVDMRVPLHPGMTALLKARLPGATAHEVIVTGTRYGGREAAARGIVDTALPEADLVPAAVERAAALAGKAHPALGELKRGLYADVLEALARPLGTIG